MEFTQEFIEKNQLTEEQVTAISESVKTYVNTELGTQVHEHTENTLSNVWNSVKEVTGIEREKGEKYAEAIKRASLLHFEGTKNDLQRQKTELEEKLKNAKGDEVLKQELAETKQKITDLQQKEAEYDEWVKNDYKGKYESTSQQLTKIQQRVAFKDNLPNRPENVNKYEWDAKIREFQTQLLEKNNLVFDENETAWLVDKENEFKKTKVEDAVKQNEDIQELIKGRQISGLGAKPKNVKIEGVPFDVPENATATDRNKAIKEYLLNTEKLNITDRKYSDRFSELNKKILGLEKNPPKK